jgi:hypothetical protein
LIESKLGEGRMLLWASTIDRDWTNLSIQPVFLPLVQQATRYQARAPLREPEAPLVVAIVLRDGDLRVEVTQPSGRQRSFEKDKVTGRKTLAFDATDEPGIYHVAAAGRDGGMRPRREATFVVNLEPAESDFTKLAPATLKQLAAGGGAKSSAPAVASSSAHARRRLLLLLSGEALLLRRK